MGGALLPQAPDCMSAVATAWHVCELNKRLVTCRKAVFEEELEATEVRKERVKMEHCHAAGIRGLAKDGWWRCCDVLHNKSFSLKSAPV